MCQHLQVKSWKAYNYYVGKQEIIYEIPRGGVLIKALILNSGKGSRMGDITSTHPKCMTNITPTETILSRQLKQLVEYGISEIIITTGPFADKIKEYLTQYKESRKA